LEKYVRAIGGEGTYRRLNSRASKGTFTSTRLGAKGAAEIYEKAPNKRLTVLRGADFGTYRQGFNGAVAWEQRPGGGGAQELPGFSKREGNFYLPVTMHEVYPRLEYRGTEGLGGRRAHVLEAPRGGQPKRWFFDAETGLLLRAEIRNAAGQLVESEEYGDYRSVDGTRLPFSVRRLEGDGVDIDIQLSEVRHNVALDDALFEKPSGPPAGSDQIRGEPGVSAPAAAQVVERGTFRIYETKQVQGEETYEVAREGEGLVVRSKFNLPYWGEESKPSLTAALRTSSDLTPQHFDIKGVKATENEIDAAVEVRGRVAEVRQGGATKQVSVPERFFTLAYYAPVSFEMMLVRYWLSRDQKGPLRLLPGGEATVERRGADTVTVGGQQIRLERYSLGGVTWGRQTLWLDAGGRLVAVVNIGGDVETDFYALREGYGEGLLPFFVRRAAEDGVDRLTREADRISPPRAGALAIVGAALIDGTGRPPIKDSTVVIEGDRITAVGARAQVAIPKGATVVDAAGKHILPGLWDMHAHLYQVEFGPAYLAAGITSARDVGNDIEFATTLRDAARQGRGLQPRLLLAGYIDGKNDAHSFDVQVDTPEEARAAVRRYKEAGYEQIKIRDHVKPDILRVITAEAHRLGMTVTGHVPEALDAVEAVEAGQDQINHINFVAPVFSKKIAGQKYELTQPLDPDSPGAKHALQVFKEHGTVVDPTLATMELMIRPKDVPVETFEPGVRKVAPELVEQINLKGSDPRAAPLVRDVTARMLALVAYLHRNGVPIVAGTDVSVPGHSLHRELELYVKAGLTPLEAIQAATIVPARVMKLDRELGTVEAGKRADLIILDADPLINIGNIRSVRFVVAQGRLFDCAQLWRSVGFEP
jgi:imidazolonepropionase-like amidohydrolase